MSTVRSPEQDAELSLEVSNLATLINAVLAQSAEAHRGAVREGTIEPFAIALYEACTAERLKLLTLLEDADAKLRQELDPDEADGRLGRVVDNFEYRMETLESAQQSFDDLVAAGRAPEAEQVVIDLRARLRDLATIGKDLFHRPGTSVVDAVSERVMEDLAASQALNPDQDHRAELDDDAVARLCTVAAGYADKSPQQQLNAVKGCLMEEIVAVLAQKEVSRLNTEDPTANSRFGPAGSLGDSVEGRLGDLGDGFIGRVIGDRVEVRKVFEAKSGNASSRDLDHRESNPTQKGLREAVDDLIRGSSTEGVHDPSKMNRQAEYAGQLDSTKARLELGEVFLCGTRYQLSAESGSPRVTACLPGDVSPENGKALHVALSADHLKVVASRLIETYSSAQATERERIQRVQDEERGK